MADLFGRVYSVTVGELDVSNLRCIFKVKKNLKPEPNTCEIKVYNLSRLSRAVLESPSKQAVRLEAGYEKTGTSQLFLGEVRSAHSTTEGADIVTEVSTGDSAEEMAKARIHMSIGPLVPAEVVLTAIVRTLGVGSGNVAQAVGLLKAKGVAIMHGPGSAISGNAARELTDFCRSGGLEWSIQDGKLQILDLNKPLLDKAVLLNSGTGMIGSPTVDGKGVVKVKSLIIPQLTPGRIVLIDSQHLRGGYRIEQVEYSGDTHGDEWYAELACKKF